jgi:hypothetical protein
MTILRSLFARLTAWIASWRFVTRGSALRTLKRMIGAAEVSPAVLDLEHAWDLFTEFAAIPILATSDAVLVQWGPLMDWNEDKTGLVGPIGFFFHVMRQFDDGRQEYIQLKVEWHYPLDEYLRTLDIGRSEWCFREQDCDRVQFLRDQKNSALFQYLKQQTPYETVIIENYTV